MAKSIATAATTPALRTTTSSSTMTELKPTTVPSNTPITNRSSSFIQDQTADIPVFLRKTYHMVDTSDPNVCGWSEDGETFVIKDTEKFEKEIIPQFFKHNKFSSFVRQLNFYSWRKLPYTNSLRIDDEMEAKAAKYWRFYHPKFRRGHPEWLKDIKRSPSHPKGSMPASSKTANNKSSSSYSPDVENLKLKTEVTDLKERLEAMTKNIDQLTTMVQEVSLQQSKEKKIVVAQNDEPSLYHKRPKVEQNDIFPDVALSIPSVDQYASMDTETEIKEEEAVLLPSIPSPAQISTLPPLRETSGASEFSDGFVNDLFCTFQGPTGSDLEFHEDDFEAQSGSVVSFAVSPETTSSSNPYNRPSTELMNRLSDALSLLPRDVQEMIVDRLIEAITAPKDVQESIQAARALREVKGGRPNSVPQSPKHESPGASEDMQEDASVPESTPALPLAAATLAALLARYGKGHDHDDHQVVEAAAAMKKSKEAAQKSLLIPVHA